ncbi:hypothetical protein AXG93_1629s1060 [Marchantia polymorpha subsp. ruderalis]|uniref:Uncharacterized protein n=1 Tax=Marchantia polymorpha subsp. ruderalis TaxID=1480154 RepID=A0A176WD79_MARPO|nr:hypothetical protein AXG93_1629s1060 [Marchantia polymorpha subsp. ruderalis]
MEQTVPAEGSVFDAFGKSSFVEVYSAEGSLAQAEGSTFGSDDCRGAFAEDMRHKAPSSQEKRPRHIRRLRRERLQRVRPSSRRAEAEFVETLQEFNGQVDLAADGPAESDADRTTRISRRAAGSEARLTLMGMELGVPGDSPGVAAGEEPTSALLSTAPGEEASGVCGAGVVRNSDSLGSDSVEGNAIARTGEGGIDQSPLSLLDQFLSVDGVFDSNGAGTISLDVTNKSGQVKRLRRRRNLSNLRRTKAGRRRHVCLRQRRFVEAPLAVAVRAGEAGSPGASSPTKLKMLAGRGAEVAAEEAARLSSRESPRILRRQRSSRPKTTQDRRKRKWSRCEVATNPELIALDQKYRQLEERYDFLQEQFTLSRKLQKKAMELRDSMVTDVQREFEVQRAKIGAELNSERAQNYILAEELVRHTRLLE